MLVLVWIRRQVARLRRRRLENPELVPKLFERQGRSVVVQHAVVIRAHDCEVARGIDGTRKFVERAQRLLVMRIDRAPSQIPYSVAKSIPHTW